MRHVCLVHLEEYGGSVEAAPCMEVLHYARVRTLKLAGSQRGARMDLHSSKVRLGILGFCSPPVNFGVLPSPFFSNLFANTLPVLVVHSASDVFRLWHLQTPGRGTCGTSRASCSTRRPASPCTTRCSAAAGLTHHPPLHPHQPTTPSRQADRGFATRCEVAGARFSMISHRRVGLLVQFCLPSSGCETRRTPYMCIVHRPRPHAYRKRLV